MDIGNKKVQGRTVSKTIQFALFTHNANAVWAGRQQLQKVSYPLAPLKIVVNRKAFRYKVGDCFKFSYAPYSISEMIFRVIQKEEESMESENITIYALEDMYSATRNITAYIQKTDHRQPRDDYSLVPFLYQMIMEAPFVMYQDGIALLPAACRVGAMDLGFQVHMSIDGGASYSQIGTVPRLMAYGQLVGTYPLETYPIDNQVGFTIEFANENDVSMIETTTWPPLLAGTKNTAIFMKADGTYEIISFLSITPVTGLQYKLEGIIRGRFGSERQAHAEGEDFWVIGMDTPLIIDPEVVVTSPPQSGFPWVWDTYPMFTLYAGDERVYTVNINQSWTYLKMGISGLTPSTMGSFTWTFPDGRVLPQDPSQGNSDIVGMGAGQLALRAGDNIPDNPIPLGNHTLRVSASVFSYFKISIEAY